MHSLLYLIIAIQGENSRGISSVSPFVLSQWLFQDSMISYMAIEFEKQIILDKIN